MAEIQVTMKLRLADKFDFLDHNNQYRNGVMYFIFSFESCTFTPYPYYISNDTDKKKLGEYYKFNQLYVPARFMEDTNVDIEILKHQEAS